MKTHPNEYIQLLSSLPRMPAALTDEYHPVTTLTLERRLRLLSEADSLRMERIRELLFWHRLAKTVQSQSVVAQAKRIFMTESDSRIRALIRYRLEVRTLVAASVAKQRNSPLDGDWTPSGLQTYIQRHWQSENFGLSQRFPWLQRVTELLAAGHTQMLEAFLMQLCWSHLRRYPNSQQFDFVEVVVYVLQWDLISRWQQHDSEQAKQRFTALLGPVNAQLQALDNLSQKKEWQDEIQTALGE